eukprot:323909_1
MTDTLPLGWRQCITNNGLTYYQNDITKQTQWEKPNASEIKSSRTLAQNQIHVVSKQADPTISLEIQSNQKQIQQTSTQYLTVFIMLCQILTIMTSIISALLINDMISTKNTAERGNLILIVTGITFFLFFIKCYLWEIRYRYKNETCCKKCSLFCKHYCRQKPDEEGKCKSCGCAKFQRNSFYGMQTVRDLICQVDILFDLAAGVSIRFVEESEFAEGIVVFQIGTWLGCSDEIIEFVTEILSEFDRCIFLVMFDRWFYLLYT